MAPASWHHTPLTPGEPGGLDLVPDHAGLHDALGEGDVGRRPHRRGHGQDRVVAMIDAADAHDRLLAHVAGVVAGELAERTLRPRLVGQELALEHDLGVGRHRQAVELARDGLVGASAMPAGIAGIGEFAHAVFDLVAAGEEEDRILPAADHDRAGLPAGEILVADEPAVLAGRHPHPGRVAVMRHHAIDLEIPVGAVDARELADPLGIVDDVAHVRLPLVRASGRRARVGIEHGPPSECPAILDRIQFRWKLNAVWSFCVVAFSDGKPVPTFPENAPAH